MECSDPQSALFITRPPIRLAHAICCRAAWSEPSAQTAGRAVGRDADHLQADAVADRRARSHRDARDGLGERVDPRVPGRCER